MKNGGTFNKVPQFRVLLVDPDAEFGRSLELLLDAQEAFVLCDHVVTPAAARSAVAAQKPDLVLADTGKAVTRALDFLHELAAAHPEARIVAIAQSCDSADAERVLLAGIQGLLLKSESPEEILNALRTVATGQVYVSPSITMPLLKRLLAQQSESTPQRVEGLTDREFQVFELLGQGLTSRQVAAKLGLSCKTIDAHRTKIQHALGIKSAAALARFAIARQAGLGAASAAGTHSEPPSKGPTLR